MADDILDFMIRHGLVAKYATGGPVEEIDAPGLGQRLHAPDDDILGYIMNQQSARAQGAIPPVDWAGDLSGVDRRRLVPPRPVKKADGGVVDGRPSMGERLWQATKDHFSDLASGVGSAIAAPKDAMDGKFDPSSDEGIGRAMGTAGLAMTGGLAGAPKGALGSGPIRQSGGLQMGRKYPAELPPMYADRDFAARGGKVMTTSPEDFLSRVRPLTLDEESLDNIAALKQHVENGGKLDPPTVYIQDGQIVGHDGRHRAHLAKELGISDLPVIVLDKSGNPVSAEFGALKPQKKADGGAVSAGDNPEIGYSPEQIQAALAYLALMQSQQDDAEG